MSEKALAQLSGGQDSTTCLFWAKSKFKEVKALSFNYNQRNITEIDAAVKIAKTAKVKHTILSLDTLKEISPNALTNKDIQPQTKIDNSKLPNTFVLGRNLLFLTYAAIFASNKDIPNLVIGVSQTDLSGYPDCRIDFINSCEKTLRFGFEYEFVIHTPLMWLSKAETWELANKLGVISIIEEETVTCYNSIKGNGCGKCSACILRNQGYKEYKKLVFEIIRTLAITSEI